MQSRQTLELRQRLQLALTPQLQQSIRLLQYSAHELQQEVAQALLDNPLLEPDEEYGTEAASAEAGQTHISIHEFSPKSSRSGQPSDDGEGPQDAALPATLQDHLLEQLRLTRASHTDRLLVMLLIDDLDENGYLMSTLEDIAAQLPAEQGAGLEELRGALALLQSFDPPGVGARSLSECLLLQLRSHSGKAASEVIGCACELATNHLAVLASGNLTRLRNVLGCSPSQLAAAHRLLLQLDPKPGRAWARSVADSVTPEILVRKVGDRWTAFVNPDVKPRIRVNTDYEAAIRQMRSTATPENPSGGADQEALAELHQHVQQAYGFIRSIGQRFDTMLRVAQAVVDSQREFFERGVQAMRPLVLRDIAQELQMHESTVSRATQHKYAQTPWGVFELRYFFGAALAGTDGEEASATAVKALIKQLVAEESAAKPLSDSQLAACLAERGGVVARRTVAKYREAAGILPKSQRKARALLRASES